MSLSSPQDSVLAMKSGTTPIGKATFGSGEGAGCRRRPRRRGSPCLRRPPSSSRPGRAEQAALLRASPISVSSPLSLLVPLDVQDGVVSCSPRLGWRRCGAERPGRRRCGHRPPCPQEPGRKGLPRRHRMLSPPVPLSRMSHLLATVEVVVVGSAVKLVLPACARQRGRRRRRRRACRRRPCRAACRHRCRRGVRP